MPEIQVRTLYCSGGPRDAPYSVLGPNGYELCMVRRGCFHVRGQQHTDVFVDPTTAIFGEPGHAVEVTHPRPGGDLDTVVVVSERVLAELGGGTTRVLPVVNMTGTLAWLHRRLLIQAKAKANSIAVEELALKLLAAVLAQAEPARVAAGAPTQRHHRQLVDDARAALVTDPDLSVIQLAHLLCCSPHHLSRIFTQQTGQGVARYRLALRVNQALDALAEGATDLSQLAAQCGFADHAHLTRTIRQHTGATPSALRAALINSNLDTNLQARQ